MNKRKWKFNFGTILYLLHFIVFYIKIRQKFSVALIWCHSIFARKKEWNLNGFHFFWEIKSEIISLFTLFEIWKVKWFLISLFSRSESEIEKPRDRDRKVKYEKNSREFSRNETLAGYWLASTVSLAPSASASASAY